MGVLFGKMASFSQLLESVMEFNRSKETYVFDTDFSTDVDGINQILACRQFFDLWFLRTAEQ